MPNPRNNSNITFEQVSSALSYEPSTGKLFWLPRTPEMCPAPKARNSFNSKFAGKEAFAHKDTHGYLDGKLMGVRLRAHRIAWLLQTGEWPSGDIDHKNGVRDDNRFFNLRDVTVSENRKNAGMISTNTSGVTGVCWHKPTERWQAYIRVNRKMIHLGFFASINDAVSERLKAQKAYGFSVRHGL